MSTLCPRKIKPAVGTVIAFLLFIVLPATAQTDTLSVSGGSGAPGGRIVVPVTLANHGAIAGLQMRLTPSSDVLALDSLTVTPRTQGMQVQWNPVNNMVIMIDMSMKRMITAGQGPILNVHYRIGATAKSDTTHIRISDAVLSDASGLGTPLKTREGKVIIRAKTR
ncbi:MAG: hypothetical protein FJY97_11450 [candidate division Zixibacteria bacterium]|nr:hypothetical protein [candidate division Zixibacteria bacterium]